MSKGSVPVAGDEPKGLRRLSTGSLIGLAAGIAGFALPLLLFLIVSYGRGRVFGVGRELVQVTAIMALAGAILFAISLLVYRMGFRALHPFDRRFYAATVLCLLGTVGVALVVVAIALAFASSDAMANCIQGAPTHALGCLRTAVPIASYSGSVGVALLWLGGLGIVLGLILSANRYREGWFLGGAGLYALLLLGLIAPALGLLFTFDAPASFLLSAPVLALLAPSAVLHAANRAQRRRTRVATA